MVENKAAFLAFPVLLARAIDLHAFDAWAAAKTGSGSFEFIPDSPGSHSGSVEWTESKNDLPQIIGECIYDQLSEQVLKLGEPYKQHVQTCCPAHDMHLFMR